MAIRPCTRGAPLLSAGAAAFGILAMVGASSAWATDGYFQNAIGARQKALAGSGVADSTDATAASLNPAGLVNVDSQLTGAISVLNLRGGYSSQGLGGVTADGHHDSAEEWVVIPNFAANWRVNWGLVDAVGLTVYGNGGVNTKYANIPNPLCTPLTGVFCGGPLGVHSVADLCLDRIRQAGIAWCFARRGTDRRATDGRGRRRRSLWRPLTSIDPARFTDQGTSESWGYGVRGGLEWKVTPGFRVGVAGNTTIWMGNFEEYRGLLAERADFDIPATLQAGFAVDLRPNLTLMVDYKRIWYSQVAAVANPSTNFPMARFGSDNGAGFGVQDVDAVKIGLEWHKTPDLTLRAGYAYNTAPLTSRDADLNIMTLGVVQHHISGGLMYKLTNNLDLEFAVMYAPRATLSGPELLNPLRTVEIEMEQFEVTIGAVYRFGERLLRTPEITHLSVGSYSDGSPCRRSALLMISTN